MIGRILRRAPMRETLIPAPPFAPHFEAARFLSKFAISARDLRPGLAIRNIITQARAISPTTTIIASKTLWCRSAAVAVV